MAQVEVYVLNYNGAHYLTECLTSLARLKAGAITYQVNLVDNGSSDDSFNLVARDFPAVNIIPLGKNYGFSKGNNLGVARRLAQLSIFPDVHVFLNNDTVVDEKWLEKAMSAFDADSEIGLVASKSRFYHMFAAFRFSAMTTYKPSDFGSSDTRDISVLLKSNIKGENIYSDFRFTKTKNAFEEAQGGRWLSTSSELFVAIDDPLKPATISFQLENHNPTCGNVEIEVALLNGETSCVFIPQGPASELSFNLDSSQFVDAIQNAGTSVPADLRVFDRGFLEVDRGHFDKPLEIDAVCGVSLFIRKEVFEALKGFDESYFAYFEDTDLSIRARLLGYKCFYQPESSLRHYHCGSGIEHSDYFSSNVAFSHLLFQSKFLSAKDWNKVLFQAKKVARTEFERFHDDFSLEGKSQLRAMLRYLKQWPRFYRNRKFQRNFVENKMPQSVCL